MFRLRQQLQRLKRTLNCQSASAPSSMRWTATERMLGKPRLKWTVCWRSSERWRMRRTTRTARSVNWRGECVYRADLSILYVFSVYWRVHNLYSCLWVNMHLYRILQVHIKAVRTSFQTLFQFSHLLYLLKLLSWWRIDAVPKGYGTKIKITKKSFDRTFNSFLNKYSWMQKFAHP